MRLAHRLILSTVAILLCFGSVHPAPAAPADAEPAAADAIPGQGVLLDTYGFWRMHHTLEPPLVEADGKAEPAVYGYEWIDCPTAAPPAGWTATEFDDSTWLRGPAHMACHTPYLSHLAMRGYFTVDDPAEAGDLALTAIYRGGLVVYLNGKEIARRDLSAARPGQPLLAKPYPKEAFVDQAGKLLRGWDKAFDKHDAESRRRLALRDRELRDFHLPRDALRKGTNVLAVEIVRAAYPQVVELGHPPKGSWITKSSRSMCEFNFNTCDLLGIQLAAPSAAGLAGSAVRAPGVHVWNGDIMAGDFDLDFGGQAGEPLHPVRIVGARNAAFSGKFVVGSTEPIRKLKVTVSDLAGGRSAIPASAVAVRYGRPWGQETAASGALMGGWDEGIDRSLTFRYTLVPTLLGALVDSPPEEVPVSAARPSRYFVADPRIPQPPQPVAGAVVPVWLTVSVPAGAAAGRYEGAATVQLEGGRPLEVPIDLRVADWTAPDPGDFRTWIDMIQSPDTLALEYDVPLWSDRHWQLIARSMDLLRGVGNRVLYVPLIAECNHGNAESMVRWIPKGDGSYDYDFSVMDKYLDLCLAHMGRPDIVVLYAWDIYLAESKQLKPTFDEEALGKDAVEAREAMKGKGPMVTVVDPTSGKVETRHLPVLSDPRSKALWRGLFAAMKSHFRERKLTDRLMLGTMSDAWPSKADADFFADVAGGDLKWFSDSHTGIAEFKRDMESFVTGKASAFTRNTVYPTVKDGASELSVLERAAYSATVFNIALACENKTGEGQHGWRNPYFAVQHDRHANVHPMARWHFMPEQNILGEQHGIGRLGGDWWDCVRSRRGGRSGNARERYPHASWRNLDMNIQMLAPGPDGAVATHRFENLRQGVLECEARILIEQALLDPARKARLGPELARSADELLRRRADFVTKACSNLQMSGVTWDNITNTRGFYQWPNVAGHCWILSADWQRMNEQLFTAAGAVAKKLGGR